MAAPLLLWTALSALAALSVTFEPGGFSVQVPLRGDPGVPEVRALPGEVVIEVPEARVDRLSTTLSPGPGRPAEVTEISAATSRSRHRAVISLRLQHGATLPTDRLDVTLVPGALNLRLREPHRPAATPTPRAAAAPASTSSTIATPSTAAAAAPASAPALAAPAASAPAASAPTTASAMAGGHSLLEQWPRVLGALSLFGLAGWLAVVYRRRRPGGAPGEVRPTAIDIVATRMLGSKQRLLVVDVEQQRFLLSASEGGVQLLSPIGEGALAERAPHELSATAKEDGLEQVFSDMLAGVPKPKAEPKAEPKAKVAPVAPAAPVASAAPRPAPRAAAPSPAGPSPAAPRPALHLVDHPIDADDDADAPDPYARQAQMSAAARPRPREDRPSTAPRASAADLKLGGGDVSGLLALRRGRSASGSGA